MKYRLATSRPLIISQSLLQWGRDNESDEVARSTCFGRVDFNDIINSREKKQIDGCLSRASKVACLAWRFCRGAQLSGEVQGAISRLYSFLRAPPKPPRYASECFLLEVCTGKATSSILSVAFRPRGTINNVVIIWSNSAFPASHRRRERVPYSSVILL